MRHKKNLIIISMCVAILVMSVGYALFSTQINISGSTAATSKWQVEFSDIRTVELNGGATNAAMPTAAGTLATFEVDLVQPGDFVTYEIDITNYGDIAAEVISASYSVSGSEAIFVNIDGVKKGTVLESCEGLDKCPTVTLNLTIGYNAFTTADPSEKRKDIAFNIGIGQYVEDNPTPEGDLIPELLPNITMPDAVLYMGYEIYPKENAEIENNIITINNLSKYGNVTGIIFEFTNTLPSSALGDVLYNSQSIMTSGLFEGGKNSAIFTIQEGTYDSLSINLGNSAIKNLVSKIRLLKKESETSVVTNKDVAVYVSTNDSLSVIKDYSYDNGVSYENNNVKTFSSNTEGTILLRNVYGALSKGYDYKITTLDNTAPELKVDYITEYYDKGYYVSKLTYSFEEDESNIAKVELVKKTKDEVPGSSDTLIDITNTKELTYSNITSNTYVFIRVTDISGNVSQWYKYNLFIGSRVVIYEYDQIDLWEVGNGYTTNIYKCSDLTCSSITDNDKVTLWKDSYYGYYNQAFYLSTKGAGFYKMIITDANSNEVISRTMYFHNFDDYEYWEQDASVTIPANMTIEYTAYDNYANEFNPTISGTTLNMYINGEASWFDAWCEEFSCPYGTLESGWCTSEPETTIDGGNNFICVWAQDEPETYWEEVPGDNDCPEGYSKTGFYCDPALEPSGYCEADDTAFQPCEGYCTWNGDFPADCAVEGSEERYYFTAGVIFK